MTQGNEKNAPIFVVGTPRSGTTLTASILGRHSRIFMPGETHFLDDIYARKKELGDLPDQRSGERILGRLASLYGRYNEPEDQVRIAGLFAEPSTVKSLMGKWKSYREVFGSFMKLQADQAGKPRWGNNVPRDIFNIREILSFFPEAKIVVCVRDVRDFLLSYQRKWAVSPTEHQERLKKLYHPILTALLWKSSMRQLSLVKEMVEDRNLAILRYEDLVSDPEGEVRKLCRMLGEDYENDMLNVRTHNSSFVKGGEEGIFASSVGRWKEKLTAEEICWAQVIARRDLESLGYLMETRSPRAWRMIGLGLSFPSAAFRAVVANKDLIGGIGPYLAKRGGALFRKTIAAP